MIEQMWERAADDLRGPKLNPSVDPVVWEHSARVARLCETIIAMPEVSRYVIDRAALIAAALYHDAGWLLELWEGRITTAALLLRRTSDEQRDMAAEWITKRLAEMLEPRRTRLAAQIIRQCNDRQTHLIEAQILADAENLDLVGPQAVWLMVRRQLAEKRSLDEMIDGWQRQDQYGYWPVWIKECLRFPSSQELAHDRLQAMARFMQDLNNCCNPQTLTSHMPETRPTAGTSLKA
jgi:hypothetical protein